MHLLKAETAQKLREQADGWLQMASSDKSGLLADDSRCISKMPPESNSLFLPHKSQRHFPSLDRARRRGERTSASRSPAAIFLKDNLYSMVQGTVSTVSCFHIPETWKWALSGYDSTLGASKQSSPGDLGVVGLHQSMHTQHEGHDKFCYAADPAIISSFQRLFGMIQEIMLRARKVNMRR